MGEKGKISNLPRASIFDSAQRVPINDDFRLRGPTLKNKDQRADKLLRYSKNFNYSLNASRDEIEFWPCVRHEHATVANDTANSSNNSDDETFKEYFDSISSLS